MIEFPGTPDVSSNIYREELSKQCTRLGQKLIFGTCDNSCDVCILCDNAGGCLAESSKQVQEAIQKSREDILTEVDTILKCEWNNAQCVEEPYRGERRECVSRIRNQIAIDIRKKV